MTKAYLVGVEKEPDPKTGRRTYSFGWKPELRTWSTQESAERQRDTYNSLGGVSIEIPDSGGDKRQFEFQVEKLISGEFVLFCEVPFEPQMKGEAASPES